MFYLGIDPGQSGGIALLDQGYKVVFCVKMPKTLKDMDDLFKGLPDQTMCVIEKVHSMPGQGVASSFKFGMNYGSLRALLVSNEIPFEESTPQKWMKFFSMKKEKTESKTDWKNRLKGKAQQFFPKTVVTLAVADALLIARYAHAWFSSD